MPEKIRCAHILAKTQQEAEEILEDLRQGVNFDKLAQQKSLCPSSKHGGDLGVFGRGMMVKPFETAAFALEKWKTSALLKQNLDGISSSD